MFKCKVTVLSPLHIYSGNEYERDFNLLQDDTAVYIYDEFAIAQFFIDNGVEIPTNFNELKELIKHYEKQIINANIHIRKIDSNLFNFDKPLFFSQVATANKPIVSGSSIKGAIRTAYIAKLVNDGDFDHEIDNLNAIEGRLRTTFSHDEKKKLQKNKKDILKKINSTINTKTKSLFQHIKISDSFEDIATKVYKTINIKKERNHQANRAEKVKQLSNYIEAIVPEQTFYIYVDKKDPEFEKIVDTCNDFYEKNYKKDFEYYFSDKQQYKKLNLDENSFLLNIGKFSGAELKSIEEIRSLQKTGSDVDFETTTRTFALQSDNAKLPFFENALLPFGWIKCELFCDKPSRDTQERSKKEKPTKEYTIVDIAKEVGCSENNVLKFIKTSNMSIKKNLTKKDVLKEAQAKGVIKKMKEKGCK